MFAITRKVSPAVRAQAALELRRRQSALVADPKLLAFARWSAQNLRIVDKRGKVVPLVLNWAQRQVYGTELRLRRERRRPWIIVLKDRKSGISTLEQALAYHAVRTKDNAECRTLAHTDVDTRKLFGIVERFYREEVKHGNPPAKAAGSTYAIRFPSLASVYDAVTAGATGTGRGGTLWRIHCSEVSRYADAKELHEALADGQGLDAAYTWESTANGKEGRGAVFYETYQAAKRGENLFTALFFPWYSHPSNRISLLAPDELGSLDEEEIKRVELYGLDLEQVKYWRSKRVALSLTGRGVAAMLQEHPDNDEDCIAAGERVGTSLGLIPIEEVETGSWGEHGRLVRKAAKGVQPVVCVETSLGYRVRCTPDHRIALSGGSEFVDAANSTGEEIALQAPMLAEARHVERWTGFAGAVCSLEIDEGWGRFLGYYMGDGSFGGTTLAFAFGIKDMDVVCDIVGLVEERFGKPQVRLTSPGGGDIRITRGEMVPLFLRLGLIGETWNAKHERTEYKRRVRIPECIWKSPKPVVREFLRGLFEADGWVKENGRCVKFFSSQERFARDVQLLLLSFGVTCRFVPVKKQVGGATFKGYELYLSVAQAEAFVGEIGFTSARKTQRAEQRPVMKRRRTPYPNEMKDTVAAVTPDGDAHVWDLSVDGRPVFSASGFLVHNCFLDSGEPYFDRDLLTIRREEDKRQPLRVEEGGALHGMRIYKEPVTGHEYTMGCDPAEGVDEDESALSVTDHTTGEQVACWDRNDVPPNTLGKVQLRELGYRYLCPGGAPAFSVTERNNHGHAVLGAQVDAGYPIHRIYHHVDAADPDGKESRRVGWPNNSATKGVLVSDLGASLHDGSPKVRDEQTHASIRRIERSASGSAELTGRDLAVAHALSLFRAPATVSLPRRRSVSMRTG